MGDKPSFPKHSRIHSQKPRIVPPQNPNHKGFALPPSTANVPMPPVKPPKAISNKKG